MNGSRAAFFVVALLLMPLTANIRPASGADEKPPIAQPLVREGDFALELAQGLMGSSIKDEAEAETKLASIGIAPRNGWIADYPVTPDLLVEMRERIGAAADSGMLVMNRNDALSVLARVSADMGLNVDTALAGEQGESSAYMSAATVEDYYYDYGPPVVSYYPPPNDYYYLYDRVDYPFWWSGFWFPGFFVLNDFDVVVFNKHRFNRHGRRHYGGMARVTNHVANRRTGRTARVDPATGRLRDVSSARAAGGRRAGFSSSTARNSAAGLVNRNAARRSANAFAAANSGTARNRFGAQRRDMDRSSFSRRSGAGINRGTNLSGRSRTAIGGTGQAPSSFRGGNISRGSSGGGFAARSGGSSGRGLAAPSRSFTGGGIARSGGISRGGFARSGGFSGGAIARSGGFTGGRTSGISRGGFARSGGFSGGAIARSGGFSGGRAGGFSGGRAGGFSVGRAGGGRR